LGNSDASIYELTDNRQKNMLRMVLAAQQPQMEQRSRDQVHKSTVLNVRAWGLPAIGRAIAN
jgi:hypothetical protein